MNAPLKPTIRYADIPALDPKIARDVAQFWWPLARLGEGLEELARRSGLSRETQTDPLIVPPSIAQGRSEEAPDWLEWAGERLGLEAEPVEAAMPDAIALLEGAGPAVILHSEVRGRGFLLLLGSRRGRLRLLKPDLHVAGCEAESLRTALCWPREAPLVPEIDRLLTEAGVAPRRRKRVTAAMLRERLSAERIDGIWMLRLPPTAGFWRQLIAARVPHKVATVLGLFTIIYALEIVGWALIGGAALAGSLDFGWLTAWLLLVLTIVPLRLFSSWFESRFALDTSRILKSRLLAGALRMNLEAVTRSGVGHLLGRVMESQALESLALNGGMAVLVSLLELFFAASILAVGAAPGWQLTLMAVWLGVTLFSTWRYFRRLRAWTAQRLGMTHELIERMAGHRTQLAQERPARRDTQQDTTLQNYLHASNTMDRSGVFLFGGLPSGWMLVGIGGLVPAFVSGAAPSAAAMAISLGGVMIAQRAFTGISGGLSGLARASIAWKQVAELFRCGSAMPSTEPYLSRDQMRGTGSHAPLLDAQGIRFRYDGAGDRAIDDADIRIERGDRILLEGASGGGKSTLGALLTGLQTPESGLLLLNGLDRPTLGGNWHRVATAAPQFHHNHILSGTLAFNLLMGRQWPPSESDLTEAETLCHELGLGDLLQRMPGGLMQRVGETGWQLSHGERSRIFLARALLQGAQLTVMDESFAALDPETLEKCLRATFKRAQALIVIAHP